MSDESDGGVERVVAVDWSGDKGPGQRKKIWAGVWTASSSSRGGAAAPGSASTGGASSPGRVTLEGGRSREELIAWLIELARETPRMVVGVDCCFSFPAWFLAEHGCRTVVEFWRHVAAGHGERWLGRECDDARFWGVTGALRTGKRPEEFSGANVRRMMRETDYENKIAQRVEGGDKERAAKMFGITPKSPFQIGGSGSVGTGSLRAMPFLLRLTEAGFRVWPFDAARLDGDKPEPLMVEIYTRLLTGPVAKSNQAARTEYLRLRRRQDALYAGLSRRVLEKARGSEDAFDALVCCLEMARWRGEFAGLRATEEVVLRLEGITWRPGVQRILPDGRPMRTAVTS